VELKGEDLWSYSRKIELAVGLRKCPYDHSLTSKAYLSVITVTSIYSRFTHKMAAKTSRNEITPLALYVLLRSLAMLVYLAA